MSLKSQQTQINTEPVKLFVFDSFEQAEASERADWMIMPQQERMHLLEELRSQYYPDERTATQGLQRVLAVVD
jgi:hypothetical protein